MGLPELRSCEGATQICHTRLVITDPSVTYGTAFLISNQLNPLNAELNSICHLLALLGAHHILHVSRMRVNPLNPELNPICHLLAL